MQIKEKNYLKSSLNASANSEKYSEDIYKVHAPQRQKGNTSKVINNQNML
jgi:hypothetical protein